MTPPGERSIRNISVGHRRHAKAAPETLVEKELPQDGPPSLPHRRRSRRPKRFWMLALVVIVVCALLGLLFSTVFAGATVTVQPLMAQVAVPASIEAAPNAPVGTLSYQTVTVTRSADVSVPAQGTQRVSRPASGVISISNTYSTASERLIANTRFKTADGKIYKIRESVTIPGATGTGASLKAGTLSVTVYAESPGPEYNKNGSVSLTVAAFVENNNPRASKVVATAAAGFAGGFVGDEPSVAPAALSEAKTSLQQKVDADVRSAAAAEIPEGYVAIPGTLEVVFSDLIQTAEENKTAKLTQNATATGVIVRQNDLASAIARKGVEGYQGEAVAFADASTLQVEIASTSKRSDGTIALSLGGSATLVWQFDPNALASALMNKNKSEFDATIAAFRPAVKSADATIRPFWQGKFPSDASKIKIKLADN
jgi:cytoskeletal protein RodZ